MNHFTSLTFGTSFEWTRVVRWWPYLWYFSSNSVGTHISVGFRILQTKILLSQQLILFHISSLPCSAFCFSLETIARCCRFSYKIMVWSAWTSSALVTKYVIMQVGNYWFLSYSSANAKATLFYMGFLNTVAHIHKKMTDKVYRWNLNAFLSCNYPALVVELVQTDHTFLKL